MSAKEVFKSLVEKASGWARRRRGRMKVDQGVPGELITALPAEDRAALKDFTAEDISSDKVSCDSLWYFMEETDEERGEQMLKEEKVKFDQKILKDDGSRRRKYEH